MGPSKFVICNVILVEITLFRVFQTSMVPKNMENWKILESALLRTGGSFIDFVQSLSSSGSHPILLSVSSSFAPFWVPFFIFSDTCESRSEAGKPFVSNSDFNLDHFWRKSWKIEIWTSLEYLEKELEALLWICFSPRCILLIFEEKILLFFRRIFFHGKNPTFLMIFGKYRIYHFLMIDPIFSKNDQKKVGNFFFKNQ